MTKQSLTKKIISIACVASSVLIMTGSAFASDAPATAVSSEEVVVTSLNRPAPRAYEYEWVYTNIGGRVHRRLYNNTLDRFEGEWIPC